MSKLLNLVYYTYGLALFFLQFVLLAVSLLLKPFVYVLVKIQYSKNIKTFTTSLDYICGNVQKSSTNVSTILMVEGIPNYETVCAKWDQIISYATNLGPDGTKTPKYYVPYDRFKWIAVTKYLFYFLRKDLKFDLKNHISMTYFKKNETYDTQRFRSLLDAKSAAVCEYYAEHVFSQDKPQWMVLVVAPELQKSHDKHSGSNTHTAISDINSEYSLIIVWNHVYMDGINIYQMIRHTLADKVVSMPIDPLTTPKKNLQRPPKSPIQKLGTFLKLTATAPHTFASMVLASANESKTFRPRKSKLNSKRFCHWIEYDWKLLKSVDICSENKENTQKVKAHPNALIFTSVTKAHEFLYKKLGAIVPENIYYHSYCAPLPYNSLMAVNKFIQVMIKVPLGLSNRIEFLRTVQDILVKETTEEKLQESQLMIHIWGLLMYPFLSFFMNSNILPPFTSVSNVIGIEESFTVFGGDLVTQIIGFPAIIFNWTSSIITTKYNQKLSISVMADESIVKKLPGLPKQLLDTVRDELDSYVGKSK